MLEILENVFWPCSAIVYNYLKQRLGRSLKGLHCKRVVVRHRKSPPHKSPGAKGSISSPQEIRASLQGPDCVGGNTQHNWGVLYPQAGQYEIRLSLCPPVADPVVFRARHIPGRLNVIADKVVQTP